MAPNNNNNNIFSSSSSSSFILTMSEQEKLLKKLQVFKIQGRDKRGNPILCIIGKLFPAKLVSIETLSKYLNDEIFPCLQEPGKKFSIVYVNTCVNKGKNYPGLSALKSIYDAVPSHVRDNLESFYFLHPGFQSRLFLATFGRLLFSGGGNGWYWKVRYLTRLEFLWDNVRRRREIEMPEFVYEFDEEMEFRPSMDYGIESDHPRIEYGTHDSAEVVSTYSMRCIA